MFDYYGLFFLIFFNLFFYFFSLEDPSIKKDLVKSSENTKTIMISSALNSGYSNSNSNGTTLPIVPPKGLQSNVPQAFVPFAAQTKKEKISIPVVPSLQLQNLPDKRSYSNKFEIFQDNKIQQQNTQNEKLIIPELMNPTLHIKQGRNDINPTGNKVSQQVHILEKPKEPLTISCKGVGAHRTYDHNTRTTIPSSSSNLINKNESENIEMALLQSELEWFQLGTAPVPGTGTSHVASVPGICLYSIY